ncbi:RNA polymerase subunit sigma-24 [bacterium]|nr:MAG: RNA polymerase subunit sigma-24 [bacterium]
MVMDRQASNSEPNAKEWESMYARLRSIADGLMDDERTNHTLSPTALVHEAFVRMPPESIKDDHWNDQMHFRRTVVAVMRHVLVDHARQRTAAKRGGSDKVRVPLTLFANDAAADESTIGILELEEILIKFEAIDSRAGKVVELRLYGGLTIQEVAEALSVSNSTVENDWIFARAWLRKELFEGQGPKA